MQSAHRRRRLLAVCIAIATVMFVSAAVGAASAGATDNEHEPINATDKNPIIDEEGAHRLLASNDINHNETDEHTDIFDITTKPYLIRTGEGYEGNLIRIDDQAFTINESKKFSMLGDGYREVLYTDTKLPTEEEWQDISEVDSDIERVEFTGFSGVMGDENQEYETDDDGDVYIQFEDKQGYHTARNFEVDRVEGDDGWEFQLVNSDQIEVYNGNPITYNEINENAVNETFITSDAWTSYVPVSSEDWDDEVRFETKSETVTGQWHGPRTVIDDFYTGIARVTEGALYDNTYLVNPDGFDVTVYSDFRIEVPPDWERDRSCTVDGNRREYTQWEEWSIDTVTMYKQTQHNETLVPNVDEGSTHYYYEDGSQVDETPQVSFEHTFDDPAEAPIAPGANVGYTLIHEYGERGKPDECGSSTEGRDTVMKVLDNYPDHIDAVPSQIDEDINATAYIVDKPASQEIHFEVLADQRPEENPVGEYIFESNNGENLLEINAPWTVFPQSLYNTIDERQTVNENSIDTQTHETTVKANPDGEFKPIHADYLDGGVYRTSIDSTIQAAVGGDVGQIHEGVNVGNNALDRTSDIEIYGTVKARPQGMPVPFDEIENPEARLVDIYGNEVEIDVLERSYNATELRGETFEEDGVRYARGQLHDPQEVDGGLIEQSERGGIEGEVIHLDGATQDKTVTGENGVFTVEIEENVTSVEMLFESSDAYKDRDVYYTEARAVVPIVDRRHSGTIGQPLTYLSHTVSNLMLIGHWLLIGLLIIALKRTKGE